MPEPAEAADHQPPRHHRAAHHAEQELPQLAQRDLARGHLAAAVAVRDVDVDGARLHQLSAAVGADGQQPALVLREAVGAQQDATRQALAVALTQPCRDRLAGCQHVGRVVEPDGALLALHGLRAEDTEQ